MRMLTNERLQELRAQLAPEKPEQLERIQKLDVEVNADKDSLAAIELPRKATNRHAPRISSGHVFFDFHGHIRHYMLMYQLDVWRHVSTVTVDANDPEAPFVVHYSTFGAFRAMSPVHGLTYSWVRITPSVWVPTPLAQYSFDIFRVKKPVIEVTAIDNTPRVGGRRWTTQ